MILSIRKSSPVVGTMRCKCYGLEGEEQENQRAVVLFFGNTSTTKDMTMKSVLSLSLERR